MFGELYDDDLSEHSVDSVEELQSPEELSLVEAKVRRALEDLEDDCFRSGAVLAREELDRAAARHGLSIVEHAALLQQAEAAGLLELAPDPFDGGDGRHQLIAHARRDSLDILQTYVDDLKRFPLLDRPKEVELARAIEAGSRAERALRGKLDPDSLDGLSALVRRGQEARDRFINSNLRLAFAHARVRQGQGLDLLDLLQEGTLGIIRAVDKFDYRLGYKFSTYATWWVRQSMDRALADKGRIIRLPVHIVERLRKIAREERRLTIELGREPSVTEIASVTGFDPADVAFWRDAGREVLSLDAPLTDNDESFTRADLIPDLRANTEAEALNLVRADELDGLLASLSVRERRVIELRYGLGDGNPRTLEEVGRTFGVTRERIRQIESQSLKKLQALAEDTGLVDMPLAA
jgi:RNA polymerase primary sigma factor